MYKIAIDGPSASGKTEVAKALGKALNMLVVDTGAIYRALTLHCLQQKVDIYNASSVIQNTKDVEVHLDHDDVYLNGKKVTDEIRSAAVSKATAVVAKIPEVREKVTAIQRHLASTQNVVMQGRDITSVVLPDAEVKIYLNATPEERACRRQKDLAVKGENMSFEQVLKSINERDNEDMTRKLSPLIKTENSIEIDSTNMTLNEVVEKIIDIARKRGLEI